MTTSRGWIGDRSEKIPKPHGIRLGSLESEPALAHGGETLVGTQSGW